MKIKQLAGILLAIHFFPLVFWLVALQGADNPFGMNPFVFGYLFDAGIAVLIAFFTLILWLLTTK